MFKVCVVWVIMVVWRQQCEKVSRCVNICVSSMSSATISLKVHSHCWSLSDEGVSKQSTPAKWNETDLDVSYERKPHHTYDSECPQPIGTGSPISALECIFNLVWSWYEAEGCALILVLITSSNSREWVDQTVCPQQQLERVQSGLTHCTSKGMCICVYVCLVSGIMIIFRLETESCPANSL